MSNLAYEFSLNSVVEVGFLLLDSKNCGDQFPKESACRSIYPPSPTILEAEGVLWRQHWAFLWLLIVGDPARNHPPLPSCYPALCKKASAASRSGCPLKMQEVENRLIKAAFLHINIGNVCIRVWRLGFETSPFQNLSIFFSRVQ